MKLKLVVVGGTAKTQEVRPRLPAVIGRGRECTVQLPHPLVSRAHCELFEESGQLFVRDLDALNGTFVDGQKVSRAALAHGSMLIVGPVTFRVEIEAEEVVPATSELAPSAQPVQAAPTGVVAAPLAAIAPVAAVAPLAAVAQAGAPRAAIPLARPLPGAAAAPGTVPSPAAVYATPLPQPANAAQPALPVPPSLAPAMPQQPLPAQPLPSGGPAPSGAAIGASTTEADLAEFLRSLRKQ